MGSRNKVYTSDEDNEVSIRNEITEIASASSHKTAVSTQTVSFYLQQKFLRIKFFFSFFKTEDKFELNFNDYATRITIAQGMLDLAIFSANAAQLRRVVVIGTSHMFYYFLMITVLLSMCVQVCAFT